LKGRMRRWGGSAAGRAKAGCQPVPRLGSAALLLVDSTPPLLQPAFRPKQYVIRGTKCGHSIDFGSQAWSWLRSLWAATANPRLIPPGVRLSPTWAMFIRWVEGTQRARRSQGSRRRRPCRREGSVGYRSQLPGARLPGSGLRPAGSCTLAHSEGEFKTGTAHRDGS
jgi:hypothetical protein